MYTFSFELEPFHWAADSPSQPKEGIKEKWHTICVQWTSNIHIHV